MVPLPQLSKNTNKNSDRTASEEDPKSGDAESEASAYQQQISAIEFNIYGYEGLQMTKSFRMPIPDVDSTSEVGETESRRSSVVMESANSVSPSQKRKKQQKSQTSRSSQNTENGQDRTSDSPKVSGEILSILWTQFSFLSQFGPEIRYW